MAVQHHLHFGGGYDPDLSHRLPGGYALGKKRFIGRGVLFTIIICAMALPKQVIVIPLAQEMTNFFHLNDTLWAVILPTVGWPFGVFLMKQFSETIPTEILEAARVDGAGELRTFITVVFPMIKPGIGALAIFTFVNTWNDYFLQLVMLTSTESWTLPLAIANLQGEMSTDFGLIMAGGRWPPSPSSSYRGLPEVLHPGYRHGCGQGLILKNFKSLQIILE